MAADGTPGAKGNPQYLGTGAPATAADQNEISTWAANNIDRRVADTTARDGIVLKYVGMVVQTADTNSIWLCTASGGAGTWLLVFVPVAAGAFAAADGGVALAANTYLEKQGRFVLLTFQATRAAGFNTNGAIGVLPVGYRPRGDTYIAGGIFGTGAPITFKVDAAGAVGVLLAGAGNTVVGGTIPFYTA